MIIRHVTKQDLTAALQATTATFDNNIKWKVAPEPVNKRGDAFRCTLTVVNSRMPGARISTDYNRSRHIAAACYHAHKQFMLSLPPAATVESTFGKWAHGDMFQDPNIGSIMYPCHASEACEC